MGGKFSLDSAGLTPLADIHAQVADGLSRLAGAGGPQAADVATSFGNIAFTVNTALGGAAQSRTSTIQTTKRSSDTIAELLTTADQMYARGDEQGAAKLRAAAEALDGSGVSGEAGSPGGAGAMGGSGAGGAMGTGSGADGGGPQMAGQLASQVGQQVSQIAQGLAQTAQGFAQGLTQLPQQIMQGVQGIVESTTKGAESDATKAEAARTDDEKASGEMASDREKHDREEADKRADEQRERQPTPTTRADEAQPGQGTDGGPAPVSPPVERPHPAQTRPQHFST